MKVLSTDHIAKRYLLGDRLPNSLRDTVAGIFNSKRNEKDELWALRDVSFDVSDGETLGIIGSNGAGKSTLLKILSRITKPTSGRAEIRGRVGSLLEVGTGFHNELSGRENIYLNGAILGMKRAEIQKKFDEIVEFSEIERFLDTPLKHYSSGMYMRLAFSVAAHLDPEILIVDEVLAVGDVGFQKKCLSKMRDIGESGRTVLFVSHDMRAVARLCGRVVWLENGNVRADGQADAVIADYLHEQTNISSEWKADADKRTGNEYANLISARVIDEE
ncbi:MAG TPA: ABC transporter ATP-binding protein, partial [Pyrinomonadaceae bacterium]|nr:ABC transporter ATP-binding protein [Pyrinomonadaceae bacterium]